MNKLINVTIQSQSALLMHAFPMLEIIGLEKRTKEEQAEYAAYRTNQNQLYVPGINIQRSFIAAATFSKGKGRSSLQKSAAACLLVSPEHVIIDNQTYEIDSRPVVVPATKGRIIRHRPKIDPWSLSFELEYDSELLSEKQVRQIVDDAGKRVGLLDFRPEKKGPFGRFVVIDWKS